jgi:hypothetical protein
MSNKQIGRVAIPASIAVSFLLIAYSDIKCGSYSDSQLCSSKSVGYIVFPHPLLYFLELLEINRVLQLSIIAIADIVLSALVFINMKSSSILRQLTYLFGFIITSILFFVATIYIYLSPQLH